MDKKDDAGDALEILNQIYSASIVIESSQEKDNLSKPLDIPTAPQYAEIPEAVKNSIDSNPPLTPEGKILEQIQSIEDEFAKQEIRSSVRDEVSDFEIKQLRSVSISPSNIPSKLRAQLPDFLHDSCELHLDNASSTDSDITD